MQLGFELPTPLLAMPRDPVDRMNYGIIGDNTTDGSLGKNTGMENVQRATEITSSDTVKYFRGRSGRERGGGRDPRTLSEKNITDHTPVQ